MLRGRYVGVSFSFSSFSIRNSVTSTCRPPGRCSAHCAGRQRRRTHHRRRCTRRLRLRRRNPQACCRLPCVAPPQLQLRRRPSRKRTCSQSLNRRRNPGSGQRRCTIIRARCALFFPFRISNCGSLTRRTCLVRPAAILKEASDLHVRAGERVLVTEQTSSDWCASPKLSIPDPKVLIVVS